MRASCFLALSLFVTSGCASKSNQPATQATASAAVEAKSVAAVEVWIRADGWYRPDGKPEPVPVASLPGEAVLETRQIATSEGALTKSYQGLDLSQSLQRLVEGKSEDLALLHFKNGMTIPLPIAQDTLSTLAPFLVFEKAEAQLMVAADWHQSMGERLSKFSPWAHVDGLSGIELVRKDDYEAQYNAGAPSDEKTRGFKVFQASCQFCHAVHGLGAHRGWDLVFPYSPERYHESAEALHKKLGQKRLQGYSMPVLSDVSAEDAQALWAWLKGVHENQSRPYGSAKE